MTGQRFGRLVVLDRAENQGKRVRWRCQCDCGGQTVASGRDLRTGHSQSCGCLRVEARDARNAARFQDLTGRRFGRWLVLAWTADPRPGTFWLCRCECGRVRVVAGANLKTGASSQCDACGHAQRAIVQAADLTGQAFGRLTALELVAVGPPRWRCGCTCGGETVATAADLTAGDTKSCGCLNADAIRLRYGWTAEEMAQPEGVAAEHAAAYAWGVWRQRLRERIESKGQRLAQLESELRHLKGDA